MKAWSGKGGFHSESRQIPRGKGGKARRASLREVEGSMRGLVDAKALQDDQHSLAFTPNLAKPQIGKEFGRRRARL